MKNKEESITWYYPEKDGFPELNDLFVDENSTPCLVIKDDTYKDLLTNSHHTLNINNIKAWSYLPVLKKIK